MEKEQIEKLNELIEKIDPENEVFNETKEIIEKYNLEFEENME